MPKIAREMTALEIGRLKYDGKGKLPIYKTVGGIKGLQLQLTPTGGRSWVLRCMVGSKRRSMGLGSYPDVTLAQAREKAREAKAKLDQGIDPIAERRAAKQALAGKISFAKLIDEWDKENPDEFRSEKHRQIWLASVRGLDSLTRLSVADITEFDVIQAMEPIAEKSSDTAIRILGRVKELMTHAIVAEHRPGPNPATTDKVGKRKKAWAKTVRANKGKRPALQIKDAPRWFALVKEMEGMGARALEFMALTAARSGDVRGATWDEVDLEKAVWSIPAARMKMKEDHEVPLTSAALALLQSLRPDGEPSSGLIFPSASGKPISDVTPLAAMKRLHSADEIGFFDKKSGKPAVPHGLRSTFRDWAGENGYSRELAELSLAHVFGTESERAYRRSAMTEQRRPMMEGWASWLS